MRTAEDLRSDIEAELEWEPSLDAASIGVAVNEGGTATLSGHVKSYAEKVGAEKAVQRVKGVVAVANELLVHPERGFKYDDTDIAMTVANALSWNVSVPETVKAAVDDGWVTLSGEVDWDYQRRAATRVVRGLRGVRGLTDRITIAQRATPAEVAKKIENAFRRSAQIDAENVTVTIENGTATLRGTVRSWSERKEAEHAAFGAPGVTRIDNRLIVATPILAAV